MTNSNGELLIKTKIWLRESIELIDYQNNETIENLFGVNSSGVVCRDGQSVYIQEGDNLPQTNKDLIKFEKNSSTGKYSINCGTWSKDLIKLVEETGIFMVYKGSLIKDYHDMKSKHYYKLSQGDIIKLGRIYLKVLDINTKKESQLTESKKKNKLQSKYRGTMIHSSSSNCMFINGQQIIKGAFSPNYSQNKKFSQILFNKNEFNISNSLLTSRHKNQINEQDSINIDLFAQKKLFALPRINSHNDLFFIRKISSKNKRLKNSQDIFLKKPLFLPKNRPACRICYGENNNSENPLICPCICKGSMKYIHYLCLRNWLNSKIEEELSDDSTERDTMECVTYNKNCICCELCKTKFPDYIVHNNIYYNILFYKPKFKEFIIFQSMRVGKDKTTYYHVVNLDDKDFINVGRANECELSLPELSVSRFHCIIHKDNGQLFLEDNTSKFGTLILVQNKNMIVNDLMSLKLQVNKTFIKFKLNLPFSLSLFCCGRQNTIEGKKFDYHEQNKKGFDILSFLEVKDDNNIWGIDDDDEETKSNNIIDNDNNKNIKDTKNKKEKKEKKDKKDKKVELIDNEKDDKKNNNNNLIKNNFEEEKNSIEINDKESLIDKSINVEKDKNNNEEFVEIESELKNDEINGNKDTNKNIEQKKQDTKRIKKISLKKGNNDIHHPKLDKINLNNINDNISVSLISGNKNKMKLENLKHKQSNTMKLLSNSEQNESELNNKNNINIFNPEMKEKFDNIKETNNINGKKRK